MSSFHGGHSGQFCDHAAGTLKEIVEAAIKKGFKVYGLSEHCPRYTEKHIYDQEKLNGYTVNSLISAFENYSIEASKLVEEYSDQIMLLRGFETEFITKDYIDRMLELRTKGKFDYIIGSVHHLRSICIDYSPQETLRAVKLCGGLENFAIEYYQSITEMVKALKPEIVGHIDLIKKCTEGLGALDTPKIKKQMKQTLLVIKEYDCSLDLNLYPFRKDKQEPYPASWIVQMARELNITFTFGDDSHSPETVGEGIKKGRTFLLNNGIKKIAVLKKSNGKIIKEFANL